MLSKSQITRYLNIRQAYAPKFSADGAHLAFLTNITGIPQVWKVPVNFTTAVIPWPEQLTFETDRVMNLQYSPLPGDNRLLFIRDTGGNEVHQILLLTADGEVETSITAGFEHAMHLYGDWSADSKHILFATNRRSSTLFDLYCQKLGEPGVMVWQNDEPGFLYNLHFSPDKQRAIATRETSSFNHSLFEIDLESGTTHTLLDTDQPVRIPICCYSYDAQGLYLTTDLDSDFLYVAKLDLHTGKLEKLATPNWDCSGLVLSPDGSELAYLINIEGIDSIMVRNTATGETRECPIPNSSPGVVQGGPLVFSPDSQYIAFAYSSATHTPDIYLWHLAANSVRQMTRSSHGGLPTETFISPQLVHYPTYDKEEGNAVRKIPAWYYKPSNTAEHTLLPAIIMPHGGPESQFRPYFHFLIQYFIQHGYSVLAPNVRGSTGYGKYYSHLDDVRKRMDSVTDLAYAAHWIKEQPGIDPSRVVVYGGSYGGFMVLAALTIHPELWAAGVDIVGISNLATFLENTSGYRRGHREAEYGSLVEDRDFLEEIAPINHIDRITAPLIVIHGANDPRVPLSEAEQLVDALKSRSIEVAFLVFEDEGHGLVKLKNKQIAYPAIINFLDEVLSR